jgi:hypothetical protein
MQIPQLFEELPFSRIGVLEQFLTHQSNTPLLKYTAEAMRSQGDDMEPNGRDVLDVFIEEIDKELRTINARLKEVLSKTDALLKESADETNEAESGHNEQAG